MSDTLRATCQSCKMPEQLPDLPCGFCGRIVDMPAGTLDASGSLSGKVLTEKIVSWKGMKVTRDGRLIPPMYKQDGPFIPGQWMVAHCHRSGSKHGPDAKLPDGTPDIENVSPVNDCMCGYYSGRTREHQMQMGYSRYSESDPAAMVELQLAGKIIPASNGWRAQKVRPLVIHVPHELWQVAAKLKSNYEPHGVDVRLDTTIILPKSDVPEWCPKCMARWEGRGLSCNFCGFTLNG